MKKLMLILVMALFLIGCDDDGNSAPADISGYWEGGGTITVDQVAYPVAMNAELRPTGYGYYDVYSEAQTGPFCSAANEVWFYENGRIAGPDGMSGSVNGNRIEFGFYLHTSPDAWVDITLYRY